MRARRVRAPCVDDDGARAATSDRPPRRARAGSTTRPVRLLREGRHQRRAGGGVEELAAPVDRRRRAGALATADDDRARPPEPRAHSVAVATVPTGSGDHRQRAGPAGRAIGAGGAGGARDRRRLAAVVPHDAADVVRLHDAAAAQPVGAAATRAGAVVGDHRRAAPVLVAEPEGVADLVRGDLLEQALRPAAGGDAHLGRDRGRRVRLPARRWRRRRRRRPGPACRGGRRGSGCSRGRTAPARGSRACRSGSTRPPPSPRRCRRRRPCGRCR